MGLIIAPVLLLLSVAGFVERVAAVSSLYDDGYLRNVTAPGSAGDPRRLPQSPYTVESNRRSDGVSTESPISATCPAFGTYDNITTSVWEIDERDLRAEALEQSARDQGVALRGEGSFLQAAARYRLLYKTDTYYAGMPAPNKTFTVYAADYWNPSSFAIQRGERYNVAVIGEQYWVDGHIQVDADGYDVAYDGISGCHVAAGECRSYLAHRTPRLAPPKAKWFQLVCGIGDFTRDITKAISGFNRPMPIREEEFLQTLLPIGRNTTFTAMFTGELVCFANDAPGLEINNRHYLNVTVTKLTWPPSSVFPQEYSEHLQEFVRKYNGE